MLEDLRHGNPKPTSHFVHGYMMADRDACAYCGSIEPARDLRGLAFGHARLGLMRWIAESGAPGAGHPLGTAEHGTSGSGPKESGTFLLASS